MHKDKSPGPFNITDRPVSYVVWLGLGAGFTLSVLVNLSYLLAKDNATKQKAPWSPSAQKPIPDADPARK